MSRSPIGRSDVRRRPLRRLRGAVLGVLLLLLPTAACTTVDDATRTIEAAVIDLEQQSGAWREILESTADKLVEQGQSTLAHEVDGIVSRATADLGVEVRCYTDFLRDRVHDELSVILARLKDEPITLRPVFCSPTPSSVDLNVEAARRTTIEISGYNLSRDVVSVALESGDGRSVDISTYLDDPTTYLLTVNLAGLEKDSPSALTGGRRVVFTLGKGSGSVTTQSVSILPKIEAPPPVFVRSVVEVKGTMRLWDNDWESKDENVTQNIDDRVAVQVGQTVPYNLERCLDDEVQAYLRLNLLLDKATGAVDVSGEALYYESDDCGTDDFQKSQGTSFRLEPRGTLSTNAYGVDLEDGEGGVYFRLQFTNVEQTTQ